MTGLLGISKPALYRILNGKDDRRTALAVAALVAGLEPYPKVRLGARMVVGDWRERE